MAFTIVWDSGRQTFTALDEDGEILGQSAERPNAVALAIRDAKTLRLIGVRASVFSKKANGKLRHEWTEKTMPRRLDAMTIRSGFRVPADLARSPR